MREGPAAPGWSDAAGPAPARRRRDARASARSALELWGELASELDEVLLIELCMLVGHYEMLAMTLNTLEVEPERPPRL